MLQTEVNEKRHGKWRDERLSVEREKKTDTVTWMYVLVETCIQCIKLKCILF